MGSLALRSQFATLEQHSNRRNGHNLYPLPCLFVCNTHCPVSLWERRLAHGRSSARGAKTFPTGTGRPSENSGASAFRFTPCTAACPQAPSAPRGAPGGRAPARGRQTTMRKGIKERSHEAISACSKHRGIEVLKEGWAHGSGSIDLIAMDDGELSSDPTGSSSRTPAPSTKASPTTTPSPATFR